jgi:hypothetical protein
MLDGKSIINNFPKFAQKLAIAAVGTALSLSFINANPAKAATFRYTLDIQEGFTDYTEGKISVDDVTYDGTYFTSAINPATGSLDEVVGLFNVLDGSLGEPVTLELLRDDYRVAGRDGIITLKYLASPQALDTIPSEIAQLPEDTQEGLSEVKVVKLPDDSLETYDFLVIPSEFFAFPAFRDDEGKPTPIVALGWSATKVTQPVPESDTVFALLLLGGSLVVKRLVSPTQV